VNLSVAYFTSFVTSAATLRFLLPTAILGILIGAIITFRKRFSRQFWYAMALFAAPLLPVLDLRQLSTEYLISDRYLYLSVAGWAYLLALGIGKLAATEARWFAAKASRPLAIQNFGLTALVTLVVIALLTAATLRENRNWVSPYALWSNAARIRPEFWAMHYNTGLALLAEAKLDNSTQKYEQARDNLLNAVKLPQVEPPAFNALGQAYDALGATEPAIASFKQAIEMDPETFEAVNNLGTIYYKAGNYETAARYFRSALTLKSQVVAARFNLALCYEKQGRFAEVASELTATLRYAPEDAEILDHLGLAYEKLNKRDEAISALQRALAISQAKNSTELSASIATNLKRMQTTN
jgi:Flp pilus assembly protein TadD